MLEAHRPSADETPLTQARHLVQVFRLVLAAYAVALLLRLALVAGPGAFSLVPWLYLPPFLLIAGVLPSWQRRLSSLRSVRLFLGWLTGCGAAALLAMSWTSGSLGWWPLPLTTSLCAPALLSLELDRERKGSPWRLDRAQWWAAGGIALFWVGLWWSAFHGPGSEPQEAMQMTGVTAASWVVAVVWLVLLKARAYGLDQERARYWSAWFALGASMLPLLSSNAFEVWLLEHSGHAGPPGAALPFYFALALILGLAWLLRTSNHLADGIFAISAISMVARASLSPEVAPQTMSIPLLAWTLLLGHRSVAWLALAWTASLVWFWSSPGVDTRQVSVYALSGTAVGLVTLWLLRGLPGASPTAAADEAPAALGDGAGATAFEPTRAPLALALGLGVGLLTAGGVLVSHGEPSTAFVQATLLLGLLSGFGTFTIARYRFEREATEAALRASETTFRAIFEHSPDALLIVDGMNDGRLLACNVSATRMFRAPAERIVGKRLVDVMPSAQPDGTPSADFYAARVAEFLANEPRLPLEFEVVHRRADGEDFWCEVKVSEKLLAQYGGELVSLRDISPRKAAEAALRASEYQLKRRLAEREILLQEVHHRVKNNLQVITSLLSLQQQRADSAAVAAEFQSIRERIRAIALVHEQLYRSTDFDRVDLAAFVRKLGGNILHGSGEAERIGLTVRGDGFAIDLREAVPCALLVSELLTNSLKHAFPDGRSGTLSVELRRDVGGTRHLVVRDDGVGMSPDAPRRSKGGHGLRLVNALAEQVGGTLESTAEEVGTSWHLTMPPAPTASAGQEQDEAAGSDRP